MKVSSLVATAFLVCMVANGEEEGRFKYEYPGYDNTPLIPGSSFKVHQKDRPQPPRVKPPDPAKDIGIKPPEKAMLLFDGTNLDNFKKASWKIKEGALVAGSGYMQTKDSYGDCRFHIEWRTPNPPTGKPSNMANSGIFFMGLYELQIYDSFSSKIYADGSAAAIYGQTPPSANVCRRPGEWQSFDVTFKAPVFKDNKISEPATITVLHNGVKVQDNTKITGPTTHKRVRQYKQHDARPIKIQGHGSPVEFRNIWIIEPGSKE